jgi:hypothetical protein
MGSGFRTFTAGEVLTASNVQNYLQDQVVMTFAGSAARSSAIGTANFEEGMTSYLTDTDKMEVYNGTNWVSVAPTTTQGLTLISSTSFSGVSSFSLGSDASPVFSSTYDVYKIVVFCEVSTDIDRTITWRLRANTTDNTSSNYRYFNQGLDGSNAAVNSTSTGATSAIWVANQHYGGYPTPIEVDVYFPFLAESTIWQGLSHGGTSATNFAQRVSGLHAVQSSFNGFTLINSSGNFQNSTVFVYGYNK